MTRILLISGSTSEDSLHSAVLRTAVRHAPADIATDRYDGLRDLPAFVPGERNPPPAVVSLRERVLAADAILFSTPEYAGSLPGSLKNLLDWTVGGGEIYGKPVAWINASGLNSPTGGRDAHESLRKVLGYTGAEIVEDACVRVPIARTLVGEDGVIRDEEARARLSEAVGALVAHVQAARV
jgi:NAD(P)H-dependent FMN reductase